MRRIFAFDPGTSALGWAVIDTDGDQIEIRACGVRLYALTRQRILETMKQRLKPADRMKARQRRRMRLKKLGKVLQSIGFSSTDSGAHWKASNGPELKALLAGAFHRRLCEQSLVRLIYNVHRHRGSLAYGPEGTPARVFLENLLLHQSSWHPALADETVRDRILSAVFHRRNPERDRGPLKKISRLGILAADELIAVWRALDAEFGPAGLTVIEAPPPRRKDRKANNVSDAAALRLLETCGQRVTPRRLHKARLFVRQSALDGRVATCTLTGDRFSFQEALSAAVEIDHDLPVSRGGSGGRSNLSLVLAHANRAKGAGNTVPGSRPRNPVGVADADALRQSLHLLRCRFQSFPLPPDLAFAPAFRTAALRCALSSDAMAKDRTGVRHHALDAILTGVAFLLDDTAGKAPGLPHVIHEALDDVRLSVRFERTKQGRMHDDTRYGLVSSQSGFDPDNHIATRKAVETLTPAMLTKIADPCLRQKALAANASVAFTLSQALGRTRRVKIVQPASGSIRLVDENGAFKAAVLPADNHHMDVVQMRDGGWRMFAATRHERFQPGWRPAWEVNRLGGKLVMRLHKGDMVEWQGDDGRREMLVVARLGGASGILHFTRPWAEAGSRPLVAAAANTLRKKRARAVEADAGGQKWFRRTNAA